MVTVTGRTMMTNNDVDPRATSPALRPASAVAYEQALKDRAYALWTTICPMNAVAVEIVLLREAREATPDGGVVPAVPSAQTIRRWSKEGDWKATYLQHIVHTKERTDRDLQIQAWALKQGVIDTHIEIRAGKYDGNTAAGLLHLKNAEAMARTIGAFTYGQQFGGTIDVRITDLLTEEELAIEAENLTPQELQARFRDEILSDNRAKGGS
jgi:hypothetical protein